MGSQVWWRRSRSIVWGLRSKRVRGKWEVYTLLLIWRGEGAFDTI
jgi:hypothetical protein